MSVDERRRLQLAEAAKRAFGDDEGITLMELLPPVGWADVATKHDLLLIDGRFDSLEARMDTRFERVDARLESLEGRMTSVESRLDDFARELRAQTWRLVTLMVAIVGMVVAAVRL